MQTFSEIKEKLDKIAIEYKRVCELLTYQEVLMDTKLCLKYQKQKNIYEPIALKYDEYIKIEQDIKRLQEEKNQVDLSEKFLFESEIETSKTRQTEIQGQLVKLIANFEADYNQIIVEIISKTNSKKLLLDLTEGYSNFCKENNLECKKSDIKNGVQLQISGLNAKQYFYSEVGIHSTVSGENSCQVFVYDLDKELSNLENISQKDFSFKDGEVEVSTMRSSGAGGQHVNTTDSAIRVTHLKTGLVCVCQNERSQFQNKQKALENLKEKVSNFYLNQQRENISKQKKEQLYLVKSAPIKVYNYEKFLIEKANKDTISLNDFLKGKVL